MKNTIKKNLIYVEIILATLMISLYIVACSNGSRKESGTTTSDREQTESSVIDNETSSSEETTTSKVVEEGIDEVETTKPSIETTTQTTGKETTKETSNTVAPTTKTEAITTVKPTEPKETATSPVPTTKKEQITSEKQTTTKAQTTTQNHTTQQPTTEEETTTMSQKDIVKAMENSAEFKTVAYNECYQGNYYVWYEDKYLPDAKKTIPSGLYLLKPGEVMDMVILVLEEHNNERIDILLNNTDGHKILEGYINIGYIELEWLLEHKYEPSN